VVGLARSLKPGFRLGEFPMWAISSTRIQMDWPIRGQKMGVYPERRSRTGWEARARRLGWRGLGAHA
jgi:predicted NUDIX family NTP pyrophosphohydrolase